MEEDDVAPRSCPISRIMADIGDSCGPVADEPALSPTTAMSLSLNFV